MQCPYCGEEMVSGKLKTDRRTVPRFEQDGKKLDVWDMLAGKGMLEQQQRTFFPAAVPAEYCPRCEKIILSAKVKK